MAKSAKLVSASAEGQIRAHSEALSSLGGWPQLVRTVVTMPSPQGPLQLCPQLWACPGRVAHRNMFWVFTEVWCHLWDEEESSMASNADAPITTVGREPGAYQAHTQGPLSGDSPNSAAAISVPWEKSDY